MTTRFATTRQGPLTADPAAPPCWLCPMHELNGPIGRLPVPAIPCGLTLACFGQRVLGWSTGSAAARRRIQTLTCEELLRHGVTCAMARAWRDFYLNEMARNPRNPSAAGRVDLLRRVVDLLAPSEGTASERSDRYLQ